MSRGPHSRTLPGLTTNWEVTRNLFRTKHALFPRSVFMPTPAFALDGVRLGVHEATSILRVHLCWVGHPS